MVSLISIGMCARSNPALALRNGAAAATTTSLRSIPRENILNRKSERLSPNSMGSNRSISSYIFRRSIPRSTSSRPENTVAAQPFGHGVLPSSLPTFFADTSTKPPAALTASDKHSVSTWGKPDTHLKFDCMVFRYELLLVGRINHKLTPVPGAFAGRAHTFRAIQFQMYQTPLAR